PLTDFGGKTCIFSHSVYLFLRAFSLQDFRGGSKNSSLITVDLLLALPTLRPEK
ncbi:peptidase S74, partial [Shigella flexneri]|nr:peptidase S74 [Shigella flexneri]